METTVKELPESRVRVEVTVDPGEVERRISETASQLGGEMKIPGFRKGKVPPEMVSSGSGARRCSPRRSSHRWRTGTSRR